MIVGILNYGEVRSVPHNYRQPKHSKIFGLVYYGVQ
jgi:hypothetical protein